MAQVDRGFRGGLDPAAHPGAVSRHINLAAALRGKKTVIVVTHRLALVSYCDHLYELKKGRLYPEAVAAHLPNG